jgi:2-polyprenyl-6-methoxyphenol hydroxylase-like FAD-dependent oxidoreductase
MSQTEELRTTCCIAGGGPAGMMLGFLLARAGIEVVVLEKHGDFFRDFRGDTIHPSTMQLMFELGLLDEFLKVPHQELTSFTAVFNNTAITIADFNHLKVAKPVLGLMPQWDFLKFVEKHASRYAPFKLIMNARATDIIKRNGRVTGVTAETKDGPLQVFADVVVATDGRHSTLREKAGLNVITTGAPIDVLWLRFSRKNTDPGQILGRFVYGKVMVMLDRDSYWQCAYVIKKGGYEKIQQNGIESLKSDLAQVAPFLADRVDELKNWDDIKLLSVEIDHLEKWCTDGLLCIGDAAHAMSPIAGVGINLAIQDAVAAANILYKPLKEKKLMNADILQRVQKRRTLPTRIIQKMQVLIQDNVINKKISETKDSKPPLFMRIINRFPILRRIPAWLIGVGFRSEHVRTPEVK